MPRVSPKCVPYVMVLNVLSSGSFIVAGMIINELLAKQHTTTLHVSLNTRYLDVN